MALSQLHDLTGAAHALAKALDLPPARAGALALARYGEGFEAPAALWPTLHSLREVLRAAPGAQLDALDATLETFLAHAPDPDDAWEVLHIGTRFSRPKASSGRRASGVFYTPSGLARWLAEVACPPGHAPTRVADLACGGGTLLTAALERCAPETVIGRDVDPLAVEIARLRVFRLVEGRIPAASLIASIRVGDGLTAALEPVDLVIGNPPFGNAIGNQTARTDAQTARYRERFGAVASGSYDLAFLFAARSAQLLKEGGRYGLILPRSVLSLASGQGLRRHLRDHAPPDTLWAPEGTRLFDGADVLVALVAGARREVTGARSVAVSTSPPTPAGAPSRAPAPVTTNLDGPWAPLLSSYRDVAAGVGQTVECVSLGERFEVFGGAATGAAYNLRPLVTDGAEDGLALITTGLIDRHQPLWGQRTCRYLKRRFETPRWPTLDDDTPPDVARAARRQMRPKLLVAGLSRVLEAIADFDGVLGGVVSTWVVTRPEITPRALALLAATLNAPALSLVYMLRFSGKALSGGNTTVGRRELQGLPIFADLEQLAADATPTLAVDFTALDPFGIDTHHYDARLGLASSVIFSKGGACAPPSGDRDRWVASAISRLYGLEREAHARLLTWFEDKGGRWAPD